MIKTIFIFSLLISTAVWAQEPQSRPRPQSFEDIQKSANQIRAQENEIRELLLQMVLRKAQMDIIAIMEKNHAPEEEIQKTMESEEMRIFLSRLEKNPTILAKVELRVKKLVAPGAIETHVLKQRAKLSQEMNDNMQLALSELRKSPFYRTKEMVHSENKRNLLSRIWSHLVDDLYKNQ